MTMNNAKLDSLLFSGMIAAYKFVNCNEEGNVVDRPKGFRNTQKLILTFPNSDQLVIDSFCSGSSEDSVLLIG
jgi:hypothetical protein